MTGEHGSEPANTGECVMSSITYAMTETVVNVSARRTTVADPYVGQGEVTVAIEDLAVEVTSGADDNDRVTVEVLSGDREITAKLSPDGRLQGLEYNSVGVGSKVVTGVAKLVSFVGSLMLAGSRAGIPSGGGRVAPGNADEDWQAEHGVDEALRVKYVEIHAAATEKLAEVRGQIVGATDAAALRPLQLQAAAAEKVVAQAAAEVARIVELKAAWREKKRTRTASDIATVVRFPSIPRRTAPGFDAPTLPSKESDAVVDVAAREFWDDFGLYLEESLPTERRRRRTDPSRSPDFASSVTGSRVIWRVPRQTVLWIWKRGADGKPVLDSRRNMVVVDDQCEERWLQLSTSLFGEHGGTLEFDDHGQPTTLRHKQDSAVGAFFDALAGVPDAVAGGIAKAKESADALSELSQLQAERNRDMAERELDTAKKKLELSGVNATWEDYAALQEAEQAVKLQTARSALAPKAPDSLAQLKLKLETMQTKNAIAAERRAADVDIALAELRGEIARLEAELKQSVARAELEKLRAESGAARPPGEGGTVGDAQAGGSE